jgi:hypothetical protein
MLGPEQTGHALEQCALAATVRAYDAQEFTHGRLQVYIMQYQLPAIFETGIYQGYTGHQNMRLFFCCSR